MQQLVAHGRIQTGGIDVHLDAPKVRWVGETRMGSGGDAVLFSALYRPPHTVLISGMTTAGDIGRTDVLQNSRIESATFAEIGVDIDELGKRSRPHFVDHLGEIGRAWQAGAQFKRCNSCAHFSCAANAVA